MGYYRPPKRPHVRLPTEKTDCVQGEGDTEQADTSEDEDEDEDEGEEITSGEGLTDLAASLPAPRSITFSCGSIGSFELRASSLTAIKLHMEYAPQEPDPTPE